MIIIYEVMAIENRLPLFFYQHMQRFHKSINQYKKISLDSLIDKIVTLIKSSKQKQSKQEKG